MPKILRAGQTAAKAAAKVLRNGGTVIFPTETLYGLGGLATDREAVKKIIRMKKRTSGKILPVIVGSLNQAQRYFVFTKTDLKLARHFWPGPLSLVLKTKSKKIRNALNSDYIAVRFSASRFASDVARYAMAPIISTSANISGKPGCFTVAAVLKQFTLSTVKPDLYVDGGRLKKSSPSTVIRTRGSKITISREGKIKIKMLEKFLKLLKP
jgi:L-threonylcarbamoyladenylate synthase